MMKNNFLIFVTLTIIIIFAHNSYAVDIDNLADQSTVRCAGGIVAKGDKDRAVLQKCGQPLEVQSKQGYGAIWIYHLGQSKFMHYLAFQNGNLERIVSAPCNSNDYECYDLR
jgi:hypothetical protein